jgi:hypothetical protein
LVRGAVGVRGRGQQPPASRNLLRQQAPFSVKKIQNYDTFVLMPDKKMLKIITNVSLKHLPRKFAQERRIKILILGDFCKSGMDF